MTFEKMLKAIDKLGKDASCDVTDDEIHVTLNDFAGFDESWREIFRKYDDKEAVESFEKMLKEECLSYDGDFYVEYIFDDFVVILGCASFDI